jgi:hypothetical protein
LSIDEEEIRQYLENKKLKEITLPENSNDIDQGSDSSISKIGQKNLARAQYIQERDRKILAGDKLAINEFMTEHTEIRQRLEAQKEKSRLEYDLIQEENKLKKKLSKITDLDRQNEKEDIEKLERDRDRDINNIYDYFNCPEEEWQKWLSNHHKPEESPANVLIGTGTVGFVCELHRYTKTIPLPDGRLATSAFTIEPIEDHIKRYEPEKHRTAIIDSINENYSKLIEERKQLTLEDKEVSFKKELRQIESIKTRPGGDAGLLTSAKKLTKGDRAKIRRAEEEENERNRKIYRGLYS